MAVSPFLVFLKQSAKNASLKGLSGVARAKAVGKLYKALPAAEKAALVKTAKATKLPPRTKVQRSVTKVAVARGIPLALVRKNWFSTKGSTTSSRLNKIAKAAGITVRKPKKAVAVKKVAVKAVATKKVAVKKAAATKKVAKK